MNESIYAHINKYKYITISYYNMETILMLVSIGTIHAVEYEYNDRWEDDEDIDDEDQGYINEVESYLDDEEV